MSIRAGVRRRGESSHGISPPSKEAQIPLRAEAGRQGVVRLYKNCTVGPSGVAVLRLGGGGWGGGVGCFLLLFFVFAVLLCLFVTFFVYVGCFDFCLRYLLYFWCLSFLFLFDLLKVFGGLGVFLFFRRLQRRGRAPLVFYVYIWSDLFVSSELFLVVVWFLGGTYKIPQPPRPPPPSPPGGP